MTTGESIAAWLLLPILLACLWRARLLAPAILPPLLFSAAQWLDLVDLSSASHPLRWIVPVSCAGLGGLSLWWHQRMIRHWQRLRATNVVQKHDAMIAGIISGYARVALASLLVLGSCAPDLLALHPWFWARFEEWPLVPLQIAVEATILVVLLTPGRWVLRWTRT
jgi:hypothetical protein